MNPFHKREFRSDEWTEFFDGFQCIRDYYHLAITDQGFEIKDGLDPKNGLSNYVVLR